MNRLIDRWVGFVYDHPVLSVLIVYSPVCALVAWAIWPGHFA